MTNLFTTFKKKKKKHTNKKLTNLSFFFLHMYIYI